MVEESISNSNNMSLLDDLPYKEKGYKNTKEETPVEINEWATSYKPTQILAEDESSSGSSSGSSSYIQAPYNYKPAQYTSADYGVNYNMASGTLPITNYQSLNVPDKEYLKLRIDQSNQDNINWRNIGILALIKFGLIKLKTIGFMQLVFIFAFTVKLLMVAVFFKLLLFLKLIKYLKVLILPLFFLSLLTIIDRVSNILGIQSNQIGELLANITRIGVNP